jgi:hypothetical protein
VEALSGCIFIYKYVFSFIIFFKQFSLGLAKMVYNKKEKIDSKFDDVAEILPGKENVQYQGKGYYVYFFLLYTTIQLYILLPIFLSLLIWLEINM